jgi:hypothetical protein
LWREVYEELSDGKPGLLGAVTSRAEAQVMRLACLYALLDCSQKIRRVHLEAALALWRYCEDSVRFIFGDSLGDPVADEILRALKEAGEPGLTQTQLNDLFSGHHHRGALARSLTTLVEAGRVTCRKEENGRGRPSRRWFAVRPTAEKAEKAEKVPGAMNYSAYSAFSAGQEPTAKNRVQAEASVETTQKFDPTNSATTDQAKGKADAEFEEFWV